MRPTASKALMGAYAVVVAFLAVATTAVLAAPQYLIHFSPSSSSGNGYANTVGSVEVTLPSLAALNPSDVIRAKVGDGYFIMSDVGATCVLRSASAAPGTAALAENAIARSVFLDTTGSLTLLYKPVTATPAGDAILACSGIMMPRAPVPATAAGSVLVGSSPIAAGIRVPAVGPAPLASLGPLAYGFSDATEGAEDVQLTLTGAASFALHSGNVVRVALPPGVSSSAATQVCTLSTGILVPWTAHVSAGVDYVEFAVPAASAAGTVTLASISCGRFRLPIGAGSYGANGAVLVFGSALEAAASTEPVAAALGLQFPPLAPASADAAGAAWVLVDQSLHRVTIRFPRAVAKNAKALAFTDVLDTVRATFFGARQPTARCSIDGAAATITIGGSELIDGFTFAPLASADELAGPTDAVSTAARRFVTLECVSVDLSGVVFPASTLTLVVTNENGPEDRYAARTNGLRVPTLFATVVASAPYPGAETTLTVTIPELTASLHSRFSGVGPVIDVSAPATYGALVHGSATATCELTALGLTASVNYELTVLPNRALRFRPANVADALPEVGTVNVRISCPGVPLRRTASPAKGLTHYTGRIAVGLAVAGSAHPLPASLTAAAGPAALPRVSDALLTTSSPVRAELLLFGMNADDELITVPSNGNASAVVSAGGQYTCRLRLASDVVLPRGLVITVDRTVESADDFAIHADAVPVNGAYVTSTEVERVHDFPCTGKGLTKVPFTANGLSLPVALSWPRVWTDSVVSVPVAAPVTLPPVRSPMQVSISFNTATSATFREMALNFAPAGSVAGASEKAPVRATMLYTFADRVRINETAFRCVDASGASVKVNSLAAYRFTAHNITVGADGARSGANATLEMQFLATKATGSIVPVQCGPFVFDRPLTTGMGPSPVLFDHVTLTNTATGDVLADSTQRFFGITGVSASVNPQVMSTMPTTWNLNPCTATAASLGALQTAYARPLSNSTVSVAWGLGALTQLPRGTVLRLSGDFFTAVAVNQATTVTLNGYTIATQSSEGFTRLYTLDRDLPAATELVLKLANVQQRRSFAVAPADRTLAVSLSLGRFGAVASSDAAAIHTACSIVFNAPVHDLPELSLAPFAAALPADAAVSAALKERFVKTSGELNAVRLQFSYVPAVLGTTAISGDIVDIPLSAFDGYTGDAATGTILPCFNLTADGTALNKVVGTLKFDANLMLLSFTESIPASDTAYALVCGVVTVTPDTRFGSIDSSSALRYHIGARLNFELGASAEDSHAARMSISGTSNIKACATASACPHWVAEPIRVPTIGATRRSVMPANTTAGSDYGQLTVSIEPVNVAVPAGGFLRILLPTTWSVADGVACAASVATSAAAAAEIPLTTVISPFDSPASYRKALTWGQVGTGKDARWIEVRAAGGIPATDGTLRIFCDRVRVAAEPETATWWESLQIYDAKHRRLAQSAGSMMPVITKEIAPVTRVYRTVTFARDAQFTAASVVSIAVAVAQTLGVDASRVKVTRQSVDRAGVYAVGAAESAATGAQGSALDDAEIKEPVVAGAHTSQLRVTIGVSVGAGELTDDVDRAVTSAAPAVAQALAARANAPVLALARAAPALLSPLCADGVKGDDETDVDCGGECDPCETGFSCVSHTDCASDVCTAGLCTAGHHENAAAAVSRASALGIALVALVASVIFA